MRERQLEISTASATRTLDTLPAARIRVVARALGPGDVLVGRYLLVAELGRGGMGAVFEARDLDLGRDVAVKVVLAEAGVRRHDAEARLLCEARLLARLEHPNVVTVHDVGVADDRAFLAMELVRGTTLHAWARAQPWPAIARAVAAAACGLAAAHDVGLVHRDVKPDNILVDGSGMARVIDFGIARPVALAAKDESHGHAPCFARGSRSPADVGPQGTGTPEYMAPEVRAGDEPTMFSDQFSLFLSLFEALTGRLPSSEPAPVPRRLRRVLARGLSDAPHARYPSMWCAAAAIDAAAQSWFHRRLPARGCADRGDR